MCKTDKKFVKYIMVKNNKNQPASPQENGADNSYKKNENIKPQEEFFGSQAKERYVCAYLLDREKKTAFIYGRDNQFCHDFEHTQGHNRMHKAAHKQAFEGSKVIYEWLVDKESPVFFQSTIIPLVDADNKVNMVLGLVKSLKDLPTPNNKGADSVAEAGGDSFARLVIRAREEEKRKLSSTLHDEIGSTAVILNSLLHIVKEDIRSDKKKNALASISKVEEALKNSIDRIKQVVIALRPPQLTDVGLHSAVKELIDTLSKSVSLKFECDYRISDNVQMSENVKITLYRIIQEAINNTIKHAKATIMKFTFTEDYTNIFLKIEDNGVGFDTKESRGINKLGLLGMKENIAYLGGSMKIESTKDKGTSIFIKCPKISYARKI
ncbi:MAG: sensor histidine kinase [Elusimicrobiota bacterium]|jgi:signal transduction histidine kinase|nr:sensor histidine kinase [Elusimicrobiota bacterium]